MPYWFFLFWTTLTTTPANKERKGLSLFTGSSTVNAFEPKWTEGALQSHPWAAL